MSTKTTPRPRIVVLDGYTLNPGDLSWAKLKSLGSVQIYDHTLPEQLLERAAGASILVVNKIIIDRTIIDQLPDLKLICVSATGYNNVDIQYAGEKGIPVTNVDGYGTLAVAQHVFALLLTLTNHVSLHHNSVIEGKWAESRDFTYRLQPIMELAGKTMGIYGFGRIGQKVGAIAQAFEMEVIATHKHPERDAKPGVKFVDIDELCEKSDVLTLHAPLTSGNKEIVNQSFLQKMKPSAFLINTGRGGLIQEEDLKKALENGWIAGAGLDVLSQEPPKSGNPLIGAPNCIITPHNAWASLEARGRLLSSTIDTICNFLKNQPIKQVNQLSIQQAS